MTTRDRTVAMVVALFAMVAAFWFLVLAPKRDDAASLKDQLSAVQTRLETAQQSAGAALQAKKTYADDYKVVTELGKAVPTDDDVPSLVYQLQTSSAKSHISFDSIKLTGGAAPAAAPAAPVATQAAAVSAASTGSTTTGGATTTTPAATPAAPAATTPVAAAQTAFAGLPPGAAVGAAGLPTMPFSFEFSGPFLRLEKLLRRIAAYTKTSKGVIKVNGRLMTIDAISLTGFPAMKATISATAFVLPADQGLTAGGTPSTPGAVSAVATTPSTSGTTTATPVAAAAPVAGVTK
ncbi:hypothetical protein NBH00_14420 [Paraconexibacter antarcticus]|uniref:Uncharacterized protein n=1 Tax=Paraconexibacter antarcticus TaxID=2949664 RepID=A0ABY5DM04_9ACTN|nr:hypothetical protein [Paraconexibacter antarcticus]UTI62554.1 hypothetical protein NBH00_14420 [Paraconexibacter antarcticus]